MDIRKKLHIYALIIILLGGIIFLLIGFYRDQDFSQLFSEIALTLAIALLVSSVFNAFKLSNISRVEELLGDYLKTQETKIERIDDIINKSLELQKNETVRLERALDNHFEMQKSELLKFEEILDNYSQMQKAGVRKVGDPDHYKIEIQQMMKATKKDDKIQIMLHAGQTLMSMFRPEIMTAIKNRCDIEILISSPTVSIDDHEFLLRHLCDGTKSDAIVKSTKSLLNMITILKGRRTKGNYGSHITVKQYDFAPTGNILIIGNCVRFIPYLSTKNSLSSIAIVGHASVDDGNKFEMFKEIFDGIFKEDDRLITLFDEEI